MSRRRRRHAPTPLAPAPGGRPGRPVRHHRDRRAAHANADAANAHGSRGLLHRLPALERVDTVDTSGLSVASNSAAIVDARVLGDYLHPDFDAIGDGIPPMGPRVCLKNSVDISGFGPSARVV